MSKHFKDKKGEKMKLYPCPIGIKYCPFCHEETMTTNCSVKDRKTGEISKVPGRICRSCRSFFTVSMNMLEDTVGPASAHSSYEYHYELADGYDKSVYSEISASIPYIKQFTLCSPKGLVTYTITKYKSDTDVKRNILHYSHKTSLLLLTASDRKENTVKIGEETFTIEKSISGPDYIHIIDRNSKVIIEKKDNGGFYDPNQDVVQLDALVYAAHCDHLIVLNISYNRKEKVYYIDKKLFEVFRKVHGLLICEYGQMNDTKWNALNEESLLHQLGYNVRYDNNMNDSDRQTLLVDIINCGIMDTIKIVNHLEYLLFLNEDREIMKEACSKWTRDLQFLYNYDKKHDDFVFGKL